MDSYVIPVHFRMNGTITNQELPDIVRCLVLRGLNGMGLPASDIVSLTIAESDTYGAAVKELNPERGYTEDGIYVGVGQVFPVIKDNAYIGSQVLLNACILAAFCLKDESEGCRNAM